ncbi:hypothetical protein, partial [uncultured Ruegeria sp.]|uniref:hypothetical protein n=1 Tax=uncultured Ruegeria sp. TaxID=259304 RepID=UPI0026081670
QLLMPPSYHAGFTQGIPHAICATKPSETLKQAAELGSSRAFRNLAAVASIVSTLEESDTSQPGAFAAIVGSAKSLSTAESSLLQISHKLNVEQSNISVFRMNNGRYSISLGRFKSYPAAISDRDKAVEAGISDSYVAWLTDWELIETTMRE